jgi:hypothetical protein
MLALIFIASLAAPFSNAPGLASAADSAPRFDVK